MTSAWFQPWPMQISKPVVLNVSANNYYLSGLIRRFNSIMLTNGFWMLTEWIHGRKDLEGGRLFTEKVTFFADFETHFPALSEAAYGSCCYNFLRRIRVRPESTPHGIRRLPDPFFMRFALHHANRRQCLGFSLRIDDTATMRVLFFIE